VEDSGLTDEEADHIGINNNHLLFKNNNRWSGAKKLGIHFEFINQTWLTPIAYFSLPIVGKTSMINQCLTNLSKAKTVKR
jgi:hypothetical protein